MSEWWFNAVSATEVIGVQIKGFFIIPDIIVR